MKSFVLAVVFSGMSVASFSQASMWPVSEWVKKLGDGSDKTDSVTQLYFESISAFDTTRQNELLKQLEAAGNSNNLYFKIRLNLLKLYTLTSNDVARSNKASQAAALQLLKQTMQEANESNDEYLMAWVSKAYFGAALFYNETELGVMYSIYSIELHEKLFGNIGYPSYHFAGELMYRVKEYERSKDLCKKWLMKEASSQVQEIKEYRMRVYNTLALAYHRTGKYDSAMYFYNKALADAKLNKRIDWQGIVSGNIGQLYYLQKQYDTAIALLDTDYRISTEYKLNDNALNALQWSARAWAAKGEGAKAMQQFRAAINLLPKVPEDTYRQNVYYAAVEVFKVNGLMDSAMFYAGLYQKLHDSIEKRITTSSLAISGMRLNEEKNMYNIRRLQQEKKVQQQQRNFIILGIVLLAVIGLLVVNRQRQQLKYRQQSLEKEKQINETELAAAKQQMEMFTQNIIEKTNLIEKLEQQKKQSDLSVGKQETIAVLTNLTILTEQDWDQFKQLFEKMYPMFFHRLKATAPDITLAEQRMAALTRMQLTARQMAAMQGISPDSVHKTRQRLRLRLGLSAEVNMEEYIGGI